jgi:rRNA maturation RNase YbeY
MNKKSRIEFNLHELDPFEFNQRKVSQWIQKIIEKEGSRTGAVQIIFCTDEFLRKLNKKFLKHDYYTDILSFPDSENSKQVAGELYISIERVRENAKKLKVDFELELLRVIIHGIFHFLGYDDHTAATKKMMRGIEDEALQFYKDEFIPKDHYYDRVYDVVRCIPKGRVCNYGLIADYLSLGSARMVGWALNQLKGNVTDIPAHRVVNIKGELSGRLMFGDAGERMGKLLKKEGIKIVNHKVEDLDNYLWHPSSMEL